MANVPNIPVWRDIGPTRRQTDVGRETARVVVVGAGPVGLAMALDLGRRGHPVTVLSRLDFVASGSKAICFSKRSLDIFDRLGVGDAIVDKGVIWNLGKVFWGDRADPIYEFDMLPIKGQKRPAFVNIQQYHVESYLIDALALLPNVDLRWGHRLTGLEQAAGSVLVGVDCPDGAYQIETEWLIACDGARSSVRDHLGLDFEGRVFEDNFLIADIRMTGERPAERWFWFDPPFNPGQSALLHKQPDDVWRLDFQLGWNIDREACVRPENVAPLVRAMLGPDVEFTQEWYSVYTFQCRRMARFVHDRVIFAGDSAHLVSPFGARGCNGGLADIDNLGWKLDLALGGTAGPGLIESYNGEAVHTADVNILNSSRSTDFMTPKNAVSRAFRDAVLDLAATHRFARPFVNSGRLSTAVAYPESSLSTADADRWDGGLAPGEPALDAAFGDGWLLDRLGGQFSLVGHGWRGAVPEGVALVDVADAGAALAERYALQPGAAYLIRPDHYVAARWQDAAGAEVEQALLRAQGHQS